MFKSRARNRQLYWFSNGPLPPPSPQPHTLSRGFWGSRGPFGPHTNRRFPARLLNIRDFGPLGSMRQARVCVRTGSCKRKEHLNTAPKQLTEYEPVARCSQHQERPLQETTKHCNMQQQLAQHSGPLGPLRANCANRSPRPTPCTTKRCG